MAPKKFTSSRSDEKNSGQGQWDERDEAYYDARIKGLDRETLEKVHEYIDQGYNAEAAHKQVMWDEEENPPKKKEKGEDEKGTCPQCSMEYSKALGRAKMFSRVCGHIMCFSCVENFWMLHRVKCREPGCGHELRMDDWAKWTLPRLPPALPFGFIGPLPMPRVQAAEQAATAGKDAAAEASESARTQREESEGLFVTDDEDN